MSRFSSPPPSSPERVSRHFSTTTPTPPQESRAIPNFPWAKLRLFFSAYFTCFSPFSVRHLSPLLSFSVLITFPLSVSCSYFICLCLLSLSLSPTLMMDIFSFPAVIISSYLISFFLLKRPAKKCLPRQSDSDLRWKVELVAASASVSCASAAAAVNPS